jgi:hypothetical protein
MQWAEPSRIRLCETKLDFLVARRPMEVDVEVSTYQICAAEPDLFESGRDSSSLKAVFVERDVFGFA